MLVIQHEIITNLLHDVVWYNITALLLTVFDSAESTHWVLRDIASLKEIRCEGSQPSKIIITSCNGIITIEEYIVQELRNDMSIELISKSELDILLLLPSL